MHIDEAQLLFQSDGLWLLNAIIGLIMFGVAIDIDAKDFRSVIAAPKGPAVGLVAQFLLLPAFTFLLTLLLRPAPSITLGMLLVASCPGGNLSNFLTYLARGNAALSVSMTIVSTCAAIVMTPFNVAFWGGLHPDTAPILAAVRLDPLEIALAIALIIGIPLAAGIAFARSFPNAAAKLHAPFKFGAICFFLAFVALVFSQNFDVFRQFIGWVAAAVVLHNAIALATGYAAGRLMHMPERDARAIALEVGIQNSALALGLIFAFFGGLGGMAVVAGAWGIWHILSGLALALLWSRTRLPQPCPEAA